MDPEQIPQIPLAAGRGRYLQNLAFHEGAAT